MELRRGVRVGEFEILGPLGSGGMGEVHRARDTRLGREVALKVLPPYLSGDGGRLARFEREARLLAALNHPGIGAIYGVEDSPGGPLLVLELVTGDTLAERVAEGPLALAEAVSVCHQIADAVAFAHSQGIVHRDLKPSNVKWAGDGRVKVLDFGLAKAIERPVRADPKEATLSTGDTGEGAVLGTPAYMSPEQARAQDVDRRTDVWSLGCILYEVLTGRALFSRPTTTDTLAAVLADDPDWSALPLTTPPAIRTLLRRCLHRDRDRRLHDMADVRLELEEALAEPRPASVDAASAVPSGRRVSPLELAAAVVLALVVGVNLVLLPRLSPPLVAFRFDAAEMFPLPLWIYLNAADWAMPVLAGLAALWVFAVVRRPASAAVRRAGMLGTACVVAVGSVVGLGLVAEEAVFSGARMNVGLKGTVVRKDLATLRLTAGQAELAIALLDPEKRRDYPPGQLSTWGAPGHVFQLAEAYRAVGDLDAARRLYRRAQEAAVAFDETASQLAFATEERWRVQSGVDVGDWALSVAQVRELPDLVKAVAGRRLEELGPPASTGGPKAAPPR